MGVNWESLYTDSARVAQVSPLRDLLRFGSAPDVISLAGGFPAPELFPADAFREAAEAALTTDPGAALQYGPAEGYPPLRAFLADRLTHQGISVSPEEVLITNGSQQGLELVARLLVTRGCQVVAEDPSYVGGLSVFGCHHADYMVVSVDGDGMQVERLEEQLRGEGPKPKLIYALPNFQNPTGNTLSLARRHRLLDLSYRHGIPILEDDAYGELRFEGEHIPSLKSMDSEESVIYMGSFSKILSPGVRLGWLVAKEGVIAHLLGLKLGMDLSANSLTQHVVYRVCSTGMLDGHIEGVKPFYRERRDAMLRGLERHLPAGATWSRPEGGLFVWVRLPEGLDAEEMLAEAVREKVAYVPGMAFHPLKDCSNTMRLNFSAVPVPKIREGVRRLGRVVTRWSEARGSGELPLSGDLRAA